MLTLWNPCKARSVIWQLRNRITCLPFYRESKTFAFTVYRKLYLGACKAELCQRVGLILTIFSLNIFGRSPDIFNTNCRP